MSASEAPTPVELVGPALFDTGVWTWARDRRFPHLADWFNREVTAGRVLICDLVVLELTRLALTEARARAIAERLDVFDSVPMPTAPWDRARKVQLGLAPGNDHRRVPPADLLLAVAAEGAGVPLVHYDRDYERIATVSGLEHGWFVEDGSLT